MILGQYPLQAAWFADSYVVRTQSSGKQNTLKVADATPKGGNSNNTNINRLTRADLTKAIKHQLKFSKDPSDRELNNSRVFKEPLVPLNAAAANLENQELANALQSFASKSSREDVSDITTFLNKHPNSRWRASLEGNLAQLRFDTGYLSDALKYADSSWEISKKEKARGTKAVADSSFALLILMEAKLGMVDRLQKHLTETKKRSFTGSEELVVAEARKSLWTMENHPEAAFRCGPLALSTLFFRGNGSKSTQDFKVLKQAQSTKKGTSLAQVLDWSKQLKFGLQAAKRSPGAEIVVPAIAHWKVGHFATITQKQGEHFRLEDPTFGSQHLHLLSKSAIEAESDGYFLVREGKLPPGWTAVGKEEASNVWGKGNSDGENAGKTNECPKDCPTCCNNNSSGMAGCSIFSMQATQNISDVPLEYTPALGPRIRMVVNYNYKEGNQPATFGFPNLTVTNRISLPCLNRISLPRKKLLEVA